MTTSAKIFGRAWIYDTGDPTELELWEHEFTPMLCGRNGAEWAYEYLTQCCDDLREVLGVPATGNFQVLFKGTMSGYKTQTMDGDDYDEEFDVEECKFEPIPEEYMALMGNKEEEPT